MILVTGATGLLGSHILFELVKLNKPVKALFRDDFKILNTQKIFSYYDSNYNELFNKIEWVRGDILDYDILLDNMTDVEQVFHTAAKVDLSFGKDYINEVNIKGTANVVNSCLEKGVQKLCHVSSIASLGELPAGEIITEEVCWNQSVSVSPYAFSKFKGEMEVWRGIYEGLNAVIVNPSVIVGPGMWMVGPGKQIFSRINNGLKFYPKGSTGYVDVRDVARAMILLTENDITGERYIVSSENLSHKKFLDLLSQKLGKQKPVYPINKGLARFACKIEKLRSIITGAPVRYNRQSLNIAAENLQYSNKKLLSTIKISFTSIEKSIEDIAEIYFDEVRNS